MLNLILLLLSVGTSVGLVVGIPSLSAWWLFGMIPLGYILATALYFILLFATVPFLPRGKEGEPLLPVHHLAVLGLADGSAAHPCSGNGLEAAGRTDGSGQQSPLGF